MYNRDSQISSIQIKKKLKLKEEVKECTIVL